MPSSQPASPREEAIAAPPAAERSAAPGGSERPSRAGGWLAVLVPAAAGLAIGGYQLGSPSLWRDEGYTLAVATRPPGTILAMLGHQDVVHGLYYLVMHVVVAALGTSAVALRLPSLLAAAAAAGLTGSLGRHLWAGMRQPAPAAVGTLAGLLLAGLPLTTWYAQDARPYALASICAIGASWLLVRGTAARGGWWWAGYAAVMALLGWLSLYALLLLPAHAISLLLSGRFREDRVVARRWLIAAASACVVVAPLLLLGASQAGTLAWIQSPTMSTVYGLVFDFSGAKLLTPVIAVLACLCLWRELGARRRTGWTTAAIALPWLVLPPVVLLAASLAYPTYVERYVVFCLPAMALLAAAGLGWLWQLVSPAGAPARRRILGALLSGLILAGFTAALIGPQQTVRLTSDRPDNLRQVAAVVQAYERPGDAVVYLPWDTRVVGFAYPAPFRRLDDIGLARSPQASDTLDGTEVRAGVLTGRIAAEPRVWTVRWTDTGTSAETARVLSGLRLLRSWRIGSVLLGLYVPRAG